MTKHLVIDARLSGTRHTGIGRYIENLIIQLAKIDSPFRYTLLVRRPSDLPPLPGHFSLATADIRHYSLREQLQLPQLIHRLQPDLVHFPHFNVPVNYRRPFVATIHDLLWHNKIGLNATTLNPLTYLVKYSGYRVTVSHAVRGAAHLITPSLEVKRLLLSKFDLPQSRVTVTHEAAASVFFSPPRPGYRPPAPAPFIVYTGSLYPHKNVTTLIRALTRLPRLRLIIVSARSVFLEKTRAVVAAHGLTSRVTFAGYLSDSDLVSLYHQASALVLPSESEGFGLTGLEAMAAGLPVICSQNSVLQEIYGTAALYADTRDPRALSQAIATLLQNPGKIATLRRRGAGLARRYSWEHLAQTTHDIYLSALSSR